jgi:hypothetical protein
MLLLWFGAEEKEELGQRRKDWAVCLWWHGGAGVGDSEELVHRGTGHAREAVGFRTGSRPRGTLSRCTEDLGRRIWFDWIYHGDAEIVSVIAYFRGRGDVYRVSRSGQKN